MSGDGIFVNPAPDTAPLAEAAEAHAEAEVAVAEAHAEARVEECRVEQEGETARAEIAADAAVEIATAVSREEMEECRTNLSNLSHSLETVTQELGSISARLSKLEPPPQSPPEIVANPEPEKTVSPGANAEPPEEPAPKKSKVRWT